MLASWVLLPWAMVQFFNNIKSMAEAVHKVALFMLFQDVYTPQVSAGYAQFGSFLAILLLEAPFLCVVFLHKATDLHNKRQQLSKTVVSATGSQWSVTHSVVSVWWQLARLLLSIFNPLHST